MKLKYKNLVFNPKGENSIVDITGITIPENINIIRYNGKLVSYDMDVQNSLLYQGLACVATDANVRPMAMMHNFGIV